MLVRVGSDRRGSLTFFLPSKKRSTNDVVTMKSCREARDSTDRQSVTARQSQYTDVSRTSPPRDSQRESADAQDGGPLPVLRLAVRSLTSARYSKAVIVPRNETRCAPAHWEIADNRRAGRVFQIVNRECCIFRWFWLDLK